MRPSVPLAFATLTSTASAISHAPRPFILLSTQKSSAPLSVPQYAAQSAVDETIRPYLANCPTQQYLIINQADLHSSEIYDASTIPNLRRHTQAGHWNERVEVGEVHDKPIDGDSLASYIRSSCPEAAVETKYLHSLGAGAARKDVLADNDLTVGETLTSLASTDSLTLIYYGGAVDADLDAAFSKTQYVAQFPDDGSHIELKRQLGARPSRMAARDDDEDWPAPPDTTNWTWFQTHNWISEAQIVIIITLGVFALLMVMAMMCVTGIETPYGAFDADYVAVANTGEKKKGH
ncbi:hypothetical protein MKZ38_007020 [Zalerion maritima]|uniref:Protein BIG1 n=1 Tax=Zalerion maritima TaxID=339359 RepID=A0AAD5WTS7_9PEZI|nr:hypothetical protein MKZ38_007020 [Zalerion maritima]